MSVEPSLSFDVVVVGGGPAGSTMGWALAQAGVRVAVLERKEFPREKVCGDFVEPGGLRLLGRMGVLADIQSRPRLKIDRNRVYFGPELAYQGPIRYYEAQDGLDYGLIVPRHELDTLMLENARDAGAQVFSPAQAHAIERRGERIEIEATIGEQTVTLTSRLVVGADGAESMVAKAVGLRRTDRRHIGVAQRIYMEGVEVDEGEATVWFDEEIAPGYGWMFPMPNGLANVGVGLSSDVSDRFGISVREAFDAAIARLRIRHPGCANARVARKPDGTLYRPLGGVVKSYSGIDRNHFTGGVLIGDAGSFVDPVTGEGITQGMESAFLAMPTLMDALERGRLEAEDLARFERDFRGYFDPSMRYLGLSAALMSNRHMSEFWLRIAAHGHEEAARDPAFAGVAGSIFGGPALQPLKISAQIWTRVLASFVEGLLQGARGDPTLAARFAEDLRAFERGWAKSLTADPHLHAAWLADVLARTAEVQKTIWTRLNPRPAGVFRYLELDTPQAGEVPPPAPLAAPDTQALIVGAVRTVLEAGAALLAAAREPSLPAARTEAAPRRRWRVKP